MAAADGQMPEQRCHGTEAPTEIIGHCSKTASQLYMSAGTPQPTAGRLRAKLLRINARRLYAAQCASDGSFSASDFASRLTAQGRVLSVAGGAPTHADWHKAVVGQRDDRR